MKETTVTLAVKYNHSGFDALVAPTEDGVFWLTSPVGDFNRATWREGERIKVRYSPDDQFAFEVKDGKSKETESA